MREKETLKNKKSDKESLHSLPLYTTKFSFNSLIVMQIYNFKQFELSFYNNISNLLFDQIKSLIRKDIRSRD